MRKSWGAHIRKIKKVIFIAERLGDSEKKVSRGRTSWRKWTNARPSIEEGQKVTMGENWFFYPKGENN